MFESPFVGLVPYTENDWRFFFGREREARLITANLFASRLTLLYGPSGVGKSSVLRAGVVRGLKSRAVDDPANGGAEFSVVYFNEWHDDCLPRLVSSIDESGADNRSSRASGRSLHHAVRASAERIRGQLLLILDQFEEYFLYHPRDGDRSSPDFVTEFARVANDAGLPVRILISLRDDGLSKLDLFKPLIPHLFSNYLRIEHLKLDDARRAITGPVDAWNALPSAEKEGPVRVEIDERLVDQVVNTVRTGSVVIGDVGRGKVSAAGNTGIETPYLQLVMTKLWQEEQSEGSTKLRLSTLVDKLGGADEVVRTHVDGVVSSLSEQERDICASMFAYLVTPSGAKIAHTIGDLAQFANADPARVEQVVQKLAAGRMRILAPVAGAPERQQEGRFQIYHDSLARAILDWRRRFMERKRRLEDEEKRREESARLEVEVQRAKEIANAQRDKAQAEASARKVATRLVLALAIMLVAIAVLGGVAWYQRNQAVARKELADGLSAQLIQEKGKAREAEKLAEARASQAVAATAEAKAALAERDGQMAEARRLREKAQMAEKAASDYKADAEKQRKQLAREQTGKSKADELIAELERLRSQNEHLTAQVVELTKMRRGAEPVGRPKGDTLVNEVERLRNQNAVLRGQLDEARKKSERSPPVGSDSLQRESK